ncbi:ATP-binding protein [Acanthopleuribacter pedis]|uniref:histidine kinase n=1 Tax=Acanthopleuribacter pedis TaxID=442870 RepID=A0A8J7U3W9_9BACT|nr:ATP-binding protein [Acanthopleuribacter pedis]MBO1320042.1 response regulator [Acanthopleuribacter pedis]
MWRTDARGWLVGWLFLMVPAVATAPTKFRSYGHEHGLNASMIYALHCDAQGLLWIGADLGLYRFDGQQFIRYYTDVADPDGLRSHHISQIIEDAKGDLWMATRGGGLQHMNRRTGVFRAFSYQPDNPHSFADDKLYSIATGPSGMIWAASVGGGLERFDPQTEQVTRIDLTGSGPGGDRVAAFCVLEDRDGMVWVGTRSRGLLRYDPATGETVQLAPKDDDPTAFPARLVPELFQDRDGNLWVGTRRKGLFQVDTRRLTWRSYSDPAQSPSGDVLVGESVNGFFQDERGDLWVTTQFSGLSRVNVATGRIEHTSGNADPKFLPGGFELLCVTGDRQGGIWTGSSGYGLTRLDRDPKPFFNFENRTKPTSAALVASMVVTEDGTVWTGHMGAGVDRFDPKNGEFETMSTADDSRFVLSSELVKAVAVDDRFLYVGYRQDGFDRFELATGKKWGYRTQKGGFPGSFVTQILVEENGVYIASYDGGLVRFNPDTEQFTQFPIGKEPHMLKNRFVSAIHRGPSGTLWVGTMSSGFARVDEEQVRFEVFRRDVTAETSLNSDDVICLYESRSGLLWIGTQGGGLNAYNPETGVFRQYTGFGGLLSTSIGNIIEDGEGKLWVTDLLTLMRFDPVTEKLAVFDQNDGLGLVSFMGMTASRNGEGRLSIAGTDGFMQWDPVAIQPAPWVAPVVIENISLAGQSTAWRPQSPRPFVTTAPLTVLPEFTEQLSVSETERTLRFDFSAYAYHQPERLKFRYRLTPFEQEWQITDRSARFVQYTNLAPGDYTFEVQSNNGEDRWGPQVASLAVDIQPAWWNAWWARGTYLWVLLVLAAFYLRQQRAKLAAQKTAAGQAQRLAEQAREGAAKDRALAEEAQKVAAQLGRVDRMKNEFLANTSHELRTPLQGIIGLSEALLEEGPDGLAPRARDHLGLVVREGRRLAHLVNDLLDFSQLKHQGLNLTVKPVDVRAMVDSVMQLTGAGLAEGEPQLVNAVPAALPAVLADEARLQQILHNLVGNAVKFTPAGSVTVGADVAGDWISIWVRDTGPGIAPEHQARIFEDFVQLDGSASRCHGGTGLGLSISKALVEQLGGRLTLQSAPGRGSTFTLRLPVAAAEDLITHNRTTALLPRLEAPPTVSSTSREPEPDPGGAGLHVLLVDDEAVNRQVLSRHLESADYRVTVVGDGEAALARLRQPGIDLVVLDVMMPGMSGFEVCRRIRTEHRLQDLPVVFLTAKTGLQSLVEAFQMGGNDFLEKPVARDVLLARLNTQRVLLDLHRNLEAKVADRTARLEQRTREVQRQKEAIVQNQELIIRQQKLASLGTLTAGIAHEINNPNNFIEGGRQALQEGLIAFRETLLALLGDQPDADLVTTFEATFRSLDQNVALIGRGATRIEEVVANLLQLAALDESGPQSVKLNECVDTVVALFSGRYPEIDFAAVVPETARVLGRAEVLDHVLMNLVRNACQAVAARGGTRGRVAIEARHAGELIVVCVRDNGVGIQADVLPRLFDAFYTSRGVGKGKGLGLFTSHQIVADLGGTIEVDSAPDRGSVFTVSLPASSADPATLTAPNAAPVGAGT